MDDTLKLKIISDSPTEARRGGKPFDTIDLKIGGVTFRCECRVKVSSLVPSLVFYFEHPSCGQIFASDFNLFRQQLTQAFETSWRPVIRLATARDATKSGLCLFQFEAKIKRMDFGEHPVGGSLHRSQVEKGATSPRIFDGLPSDQEDVLTTHVPPLRKNVVYLAATPQLESQVRALKKAASRLEAALADLLSPSRVRKTLERVAQDRSLIPLLQATISNASFRASMKRKAKDV